MGYSKLEPKFNLGRIVATAGVMSLGIDLIPFIRRHHCGEWGDLCADDKEANDLAREHNIMSVGVAIDLEGEHQLSLTTCDGLIKYREGLRLARQDHLQKLSNLPIINTGGYGSAEELSITITSMKLHENPLAPVILLDPDNLWAHMQEQLTEIAVNNYGPQFIPQLVKSCRNGDDALSELVRFCVDPDAWYLENNIPEDSIQTARVKARRIRAETLYQSYVEVFDSPNPRLSD